MARNVKKAEDSKYRFVPPSERADIQRPAWCTRIYRNNKYHVLIDDRPGEPALAMVVPHNAGRDVFWSDLQDLKNQIFGEETTAAMYYPPESELIDVANVYWLFVGNGVSIPGKIPRSSRPREM